MLTHDHREYHYENESFLSVGIVTGISLFIALMFVCSNLDKHMKSDYSKEVKIGIQICLVAELCIIMLLGLALFFYKIAEPFMILVNV